MPRILVTAGPTREPIDAVRYLSNRSSGKVGLAIVEAALELDWPVTLLLGPGTEYPPNHPLLETLSFTTANELQTLLETTWPESDILFMAAAVADFRPKCPLAGAKLKRERHTSLELEPVEDMLAGLAALSSPGQIRIGFALEDPKDLLERARKKLQTKDLDAIVANPLSTMESDSIEATLIHRDGHSEELPGPTSKKEFAQWLLERISSLIHTCR